MLRENSITYIPLINKRGMRMLLVHWLISTTIISCSVKNSYAEEAYAMPLPAPQESLQLPAQEPLKQIPYVNTLFLSYINAPLSKKEPTRGDFENAPLLGNFYKGVYYPIEDRKEQLEEKITEGINKSEWKDKVGIDKISTKMDQDKVRTKLRFKIFMNMEPTITVDAKAERTIDAKAELSYRW